VPAPSLDTLGPAELAWLAVVPCALLVLGIMMVLGPTVGKIVDHGAPNDFWPGWVRMGGVQPEPTEQGRYVLSLAAPLLVSAATLVATRRGARMRPALARVLVRASQVVTALFAIGVVVVIQHLHNKFGSHWEPRRYFTWRAIGIACGLAGTVVLLTAPRMRARMTALLRESRTKHIAALSIGALVVTAWLLTGVNTDLSIGNATATFEEYPQSFDIAWAALSGHGPLVGIHSLYSHLVPYIAAGSMELFGANLTVFSVTMESLTLIGMMCAFTALRRVSRSSVAALLLFLPFVATSFFMIKGASLVDREDPANLFAAFPERYALPYVLALLVARHLGRARPRTRWALFLVAGVVLLNDFEFGIACFGATIAALLWTERPPTARGIGTMLAAGALGIAVSAVGFTLFTLVFEGSLPHFSWVLTYVRIYGAAGYAMWGMPSLGIHLVVFLTFAAALVAATVRALRRDADETLTGMLAWSGVFGFGTFAYYVGQSHPENLIVIFSSWAFAGAMLTLAVVRALAAGGRRPRLYELTVLFAFGLFACSLAQIPAPWSQIDRIGGSTGTPIFTHNSVERFMEADTRPGEAVLLLNRLPHRLAYDLGLYDVVEWPSGIAVMPIRSELIESIARLRAHHGHKIFAWSSDFFFPEIFERLQRDGFRVTRQIQDDSIQKEGGVYVELRDDVGARSR
jgi:hypothetical protein